MTILVLSCNKTETNQPESTLINLNYPQGFGQSGDSLTSTVGFGYDATGICDTLSVKCKILNLNNQHYLDINKINTSGPGVMISGYGYIDLLRNIEYYPNRVNEPSISFLSHIKSLLKLANIIDTSQYGNLYSYAYYSYFKEEKCINYYINKLDIESELTESFKSDIKNLTPEAILKKYGTHVIVGATIGAKFEVLYKCELKQNLLGAVDVSDLLYKRVNEYLGLLPGTKMDKDINTSLQSNEQLVFNTLGFRKKIFGLINATNNNSNKIKVDLIDVFNSGTNYQFVKIGKDGLIPLYELVINVDKKQALKGLIEKATSNSAYKK